MIAFSRGTAGCVAINNEDGASPAPSPPACPPAPTRTCRHRLGDGGRDGNGAVTVPAKGAVAIHVGTSASPSPTGNSATVYYYTR